MKTEFEFIDHIRKKLGAERIGDDCAVLPKDDKTDQLITADLLVEDVDFRLDWCSPLQLGQKALAVSLSDIAAMGGTPKWAMTTIGVPQAIWQSDFLKSFYDGWGRVAQEFGVELIGGDISRTPDKIVIDSIVGGEVARGKALLRRGARPGNPIFVTGHLGGAAGGLRLLESKVRNRGFSEMENALVERQLTPVPRVQIGRSILQANAATAMIDLSDGLSSDLAHLCTASGVGAHIDASLIPSDPNLSALMLSSDEILDLALNGGEDFELLFTADEKINTFPNFREFHRIGVVTPNVGIIELTNGSKTTRLAAKGYRHF